MRASVFSVLPKYLIQPNPTQCRYYTISSSSSVEPKKLAMTVSVIKEVSEPREASEPFGRREIYTSHY